MTTYQALSLESLPDSLAEVVDAIGLPSTLRLVESFPGVRVYVPRTLDDDHALVSVLGRDDAQRLTDQFSGEALSIPRCAGALRAVRNACIWRERSEGAAALALRYHLTERQVYSVLASAQSAQDDQQQDLFE